MNATRRTFPTSVACELARGAALCPGAAALVIAGVGAAVRLTGQAGAARRLLDLAFLGLPHSASQALAIAAHNARFAAAILLGALLAPRAAPPLRVLLHVYLVLLLVLNAAAVGVVIGAYGNRAATALLGHLPLELAALSLAGGAYLTALRSSLTGRALTAVAAVCSVLLLAAAALETYVSAGGGP